MLLERRLGFYLHGWIPAFIQTRMRGFQSSGIFEWWNKLVAVHLVKVRANSKRFQQTRSTKQNKSSEINWLLDKKEQKERSKHLIELVMALLMCSLVAFIFCLLEIFWHYVAGKLYSIGIKIVNWFLIIV